jgi:quercetin dioxygenase-like cupin family protein
VVVLKGHGMFAVHGEPEQAFGRDSLLIFDAGEVHSVRALDEELIFVGFLQGVTGTRPDRTGGEMAEEQVKEPTVAT